MAVPRPTRVVPLVLAILALVPAKLSAQIIPLRTVPVATGEQFTILPSLNLGMAGVTVALDDPWLDGFENPALGSRLVEPVFLASPTFYGIEGDNGAGRSIPLSGLFGGRRWFGGASVALQQIVDENGSCCWAASPPQPLWDKPAIDVVDYGWPRSLDDSDATNEYAAGFLGLRLGDRWAVGVGAAAASLNAVDGVDLLYSNSQSIDQDGSTWSVRGGATGDLGRGRRIDAVLVHERFAMDHDVSYVQWVWDPRFQQGYFIERVEHNEDRTHTTGLQLGFTAPVGEGWRAGPLFTVNRKTHPKIPNYDIANIPRDPGESWAFEMGGGLARFDGPFRFGVDVVYAPAWSETWSEAADTVRTAEGKLLHAGDHTVENDFFLTNLSLRMGLGRETRRWGFQLGLQASARETELKQWNVIAATRRKQDESWMEWTPSLGATLRFPEVEVRYAGWVTTGTGRPSVNFSVRPGTARAEAAADTGDFLVPPAGPVLLQEARVTTHRITVSLPVR